MEEKLQKIILLIEQSNLDQTIKDILIRDLQTEGLTDFLKEQIIAYCTESIEEIERTKTMMADISTINPAE